MTNINTGPTGQAAALGRVTFIDGQGELPMIEVTTPWSRAEIYMHGAHVAQFKKNDEPPLLFLSQCSRFADGQPIRGGIPVIFPWFGSREGLGQHGFARIKDWELKEFTPAADGSVSVRFRLPASPEAKGFPPFTADYLVKVSQSLTLQLIVTNNSTDADFSFENCLHTYFQVADITQVSVVGLKGAGYLDKADNYTPKTEQADAITFAGEVDRTYMDTAGPVEILDRSLRRKILVAKTGSHSTVVWNPWIAKAAQMPDFGNDEYKQMVCVESGNVGRNKITLAPGQSCAMRVELSATPL